MQAAARAGRAHPRIQRRCRRISPPPWRNRAPDRNTAEGRAGRDLAAHTMALQTDTQPRRARAPTREGATHDRDAAVADNARSKQGYRIAIERHSEPISRRHGKSLQEISADPRELVRVLTLEQYVPAPARRDALDRAWRGPDYREPGAFPHANQTAQPASASNGKVRDTRLDATAEYDVRESIVRRIHRLYSSGQLFGDERHVVVSHGTLHCMMARHSRLNEYFAAACAAPRASGHLAQKLEAPLARTKIRQIDTDVGVDHSDKRNVRKIQSLRDHLRTEQDVDLTRAYAIQDLRVRPLSRRRVDIHARNPRRRKALADQTFHLLRAESAASQRCSTATIAHTLRLLLMHAVMTDQSLRRAMIRESNAAVGARRDVAAVLALHERRVATAVEQQDALLFAIESGANSRVERRRYDSLIVVLARSGSRVEGSLA